MQKVFAKLQARSVATPIENIDGYLFRSAANVLSCVSIYGTLAAVRRGI